ncbi:MULTISPECIES: PEP-CTERM sorting domain-containing protein [unclassified Microcystis]|uniref:PEP-CTERM sorting domain-containing protein n=1 Tax=unclassified Microcystis TaxID=2643300 RepID=UPI001194C070|nr:MULTISPECIES: PEP-CTERM sorting domain-containing protein [unclassified Microcystis]MCA2926413.1 PEP-CTERM sorting domain-containing protein [Microcystis sp. M020S1]MCA2933529.1 PEP-CTERM sorting domain-containing protein [Microcystis sp. M015S1]MCA2619892.1 PEP-CTERM sorting domain-containing protein [Microcystis sp. M099S2]MCA2650259.1 PEP-CTERM sorting domain-containing protein [Microcystis sp. M065S2]MCA2679269.1 PEP-CTERM sorting domain-containing protein [Microcystis sp. M043S2]
MITNISRRLTTGALAIAGSVAAFGFAGAAPAQAQTSCSDRSLMVLSQFMALTSGCIDMDKIYKFDAATTTNTTDFLDGFIAISNSTGSAGEGVHRMTYTRRPTFPSTIGTKFTLGYTVEIAPFSTAMFDQVSLGVDVAGQLPGITTKKYISSTAIGSNDVGLLTSLNGGTPVPVPVPSGVRKLFILDEIEVTAATAQVNAFTNTYTQKKSIDIPEPSAILGILAVAGVGAFACRKS